jgi:hypothetical protein
MNLVTFKVIGLVLIAAGIILITIVASRGFSNIGMDIIKIIISLFLILTGFVFFAMRSY